MGHRIGYIALAILMAALLYAIGSSTIRRMGLAEDTARRARTKIALGLIGWHLYIALMDRTGLLHTLSFPPRFALALILPAFVIIGVFIARHRHARWLDALPPAWLFYAQGFRVLLEGLFVLSVAAGLLHPHVTVEGYNYDMVFGALTPLVGYVVIRREALPRAAAVAWNALGLLVIAFIIFLFLTTTYAPHLYGASEPLLPVSATHYPFTLVAGFLMPSAVFMHVLSIVQLTRRPMA